MFIDACPFTEHGVAPGIVNHIYADAVDNEKLVLVYVSRIRLIRTRLGGEGRGPTLGAGMAVQAELKTAERRVIDYLLSPIAKTLDEAGGER